MGGGKRTRERALPKMLGPLQKSFCSALFRGFLYMRGGGKRTVRGGGPKPLFGRGVIHEVFHPTSFFHPPMASSENLP